MSMPKPKVVANLQDRKAALDAAEDASTGDKRERAQEAKAEAASGGGLPKPQPGVFKKLKALVTGTNPYADK